MNMGYKCSMNYQNTNKTHFLLKLLSKITTNLPLPSNMSYYWNLGSLLGLCLSMQMITGMLLAMHYCPNNIISFDSITHTTQNISGGFILRNSHASGASAFFLCAYLHIKRNIYHSTWKNHMTWSMGMIMYMSMILTAFVGYVLPWGQMSFWAATVMTNLLSAMPYMGNTMVQWIWGSFSVSNSTLNRFYSLHYSLPFALLLLTMMHILALHTQKQSNPSGVQSSTDKIPFHLYYSLKDTHTAMMISMFMFFLTTTTPHTLSDPENFLKANPLITPTHMQPEWYLLFAYAILRSIPNKLGGVLALLASMLVLYCTLFLSRKNLMTSNHRPNFKTTIWSLTMTFSMLTWMGSMPAEAPYTTLSLMITSWYFTMIMALLPTHTHKEKTLIHKYKTLMFL